MKIHPGKVFPRIALLVVGVLFGVTMAGHAGGKVAAWGDNTFGQCLLPNGLNNVKAIAAGFRHSVALKPDGTLVAWGQHDSGGATNVPSGLSGVKAVAAGANWNLALKSDGAVVAWGAYGMDFNVSGLSNVTSIAAGWYHWLALRADGSLVTWSASRTGYSPTNVPAGLSNFVAIAAGSEFSLALKSDGTVVAWGWNAFGQTDVPHGLSNVVAIATSSGSIHSLALKSDGTVAAWGDNSVGQTAVPPGLSGVVAVAAGGTHSLALLADGTIVSWGAGTYHGYYPHYGQSIVPQGPFNVTAIACGNTHSLALVSDGPPEILVQPADAEIPFQSNITFTATATGFEPLSYRWLFNGYPLNDSARISGATNASLTISNAQFSDIGTYSVIVSNGLGMVQSTGAVLTVISPPIITLQPIGRTVIAGTNITLTAAATGTPPLSYQWLLDGTPIPAKVGTSLTLSNVQSSQSGNYSLRVTNVYGVTNSSNALVTVLESPPYILNQPSNRSSFLGGTATFTVNARGSTPLSYQWRFNGADIPGATNVTLTLTSLRYEQAGYYTVAISNTFGVTVSAKAQVSVLQVAVWGSSSSVVPANVPAGLTNLVAISAGLSHLLALKSDGTLASWAGNTPRIQGIGLTNIPPGLTNVTAIAAGGFHSLALKSNGVVVAWGSVSFSRDPFAPIPYPNPATNVPAGLSNIIAIAAGNSHSLALKSDGTVTGWGYYSYNFVRGSGSATNVPASLSNVVAIAAGGAQSMALKSDGRVVAWGSGTNVPTGLSNVVAIACGRDFNLALQTNGKVVAWAQTLPYIPIIPPVGTFVPPDLSNVVAIAAGGYGMALRADGSVATWGGSGLQTPAGLSNVFAIAAGGSFLAALTGDGSPRFTIQPASQAATRGSTARFHARAVGVQPLSYHWQLDGEDLPGATNADLTIASAQGKDTGSYRAVVANALGSVTSSPATLTIPFSTHLAAALNATNLAWTTGPTNAPWFAQIRETHDGDVAAQSGRIGHNQQSTLQTTVVGPGTLTFWWKVSSEEAYDRLWFSMDYLNWADWISGETDWRQFTFHVPAGSHVLRWAYTKDDTVSTGQDAGWLDEVMFTPASPLVLTAPQLLPDGSFVFGSSDPGGRSLLPQNLAGIEIQASTNLRDWVTLTGDCTLTNGALLVRDPDSVHHPQRFYRMVER